MQREDIILEVRALGLLVGDGIMGNLRLCRMERVLRQGQRHWHTLVSPFGPPSHARPLPLIGGTQPEANLPGSRSSEPAGVSTWAIHGKFEKQISGQTGQAPGGRS